MKDAKEWMLLVVATVAVCVGAAQQNKCPVASPDGICTNIPYADRAGCELDLYIPQGVSNFPVVVWPHSDIGTGNQAFQCAQFRWRHGSAVPAENRRACPACTCVGRNPSHPFCVWTASV